MKGKLSVVFRLCFFSVFMKQSSQNPHWSVWLSCCEAQSVLTVSSSSSSSASNNWQLYLYVCICMTLYCSVWTDAPKLKRKRHDSVKDMTEISIKRSREVADKHFVSLGGKTQCTERGHLTGDSWVILTSLFLCFKIFSLLIISSPHLNCYQRSPELQHAPFVLPG